MSDSYKHVMKGAGKLKLKSSSKKLSMKPSSNAPKGIVAPKSRGKLERAVASSITRDPEEIVRGRKRARAEEAAAKKTAQEDSGLDELPSSLTAAEKAFIKHTVKHTEKRDLAKKARMSHRERIDEMNSYLANLPVHNDVPKTAAAGLG